MSTLQAVSRPRDGRFSQPFIDDLAVCGWSPALSTRPGDIADAPCGRGFIALLEALRATGGTMPGDIVGHLLEEHRRGNAVSLAKLIYSGQAFGFEWRTSLWIPMFQFDADDLSLKAAPQRVRAELPALWSGWTVACWFAAPNVQLDGHRPADMLDDDYAAVLRAAQALIPAAAIAARGMAARPASTLRRATITPNFLPNT